MKLEAWTLLGGALEPTLWAFVLCALRVAPITYLCPLLGGLALPVPVPVRVACVLSLSAALCAMGIQIPETVAGGAALVGAAVRELTLGLVLGWVSALPFEGARMGGKLADLFRGTSAEAALPGVGASDSASAEGLHRLCAALAASGLAFPQIVGTLLRSFVGAPLGTFELLAEGVSALPELALSSMVTGLAISAPVLAVSLGVEALIALAGRVAPGIPILEAAAPTRILGGGAVLWLALALMAQRFQQALSETPGLLGSLLQGS